MRGITSWRSTKVNSIWSSCLEQMKLRWNFAFLTPKYCHLDCQQKYYCQESQTCHGTASAPRWLQIKPKNPSDLNQYCSVNSLIFWTKAQPGFLVPTSCWGYLTALFLFLRNFGGKCVCSAICLCMLRYLFLSGIRVTPLRLPPALPPSWSPWSWPGSPSPSTQIHLGPLQGPVLHSPMTVVSKCSYKSIYFSSKASESPRTYSLD